MKRLLIRRRQMETLAGKISTSHHRAVESETTRSYSGPGPDPEKSFNILTSWRARQYEYPVLSQMSRDYLPIPAMSAASERVFSNSTNTVTKMRYRMAPETLREMLCLRSWGVRLEPEESGSEDFRDWNEE